MFETLYSSPTAKKTTINQASQGGTFSNLQFTQPKTTVKKTTVLVKQPNLIENVISGINFILHPKIISPIPEKNIVKTQPLKLQPNQKKLTQPQMQQIGLEPTNVKNIKVDAKKLKEQMKTAPDPVKKAFNELKQAGIDVLNAFPGNITPEEKRTESQKRGLQIVQDFLLGGGAINAAATDVGFIANKVVQKILSKLPKGEVAPEKIIQAVIDTKTETTTEGKAFVKAAVQAEKEGKSITIETPPPPPKKVVGESGGVVKTEVKPITKVVEQKATPIVKPKEVSVPREQLPVASKEGVEKISRLEARVTGSLEKTPQEIKDQLGSTFTTMNKKEQISKAVKYVNDNPEEALAVLKGEKEAPKDILKNSIYVAMENQAKEDVALARKLASLASTRQGQELSILTEIDRNSPVRILRDLIKVREEAFSKRFSGQTLKDVRTKYLDRGKANIKAPVYNDWGSIIKEVRC